MRRAVWRYAGIAGQPRERDQTLEGVGVALVHVGLERRVPVRVVGGEPVGGVERVRVAGRGVVVDEADQAAAHAEPFLVVGGGAVGAEAAVRLLVADQALRHAADAVVLAGVPGQQRHRAEPAAGIVGAPVPHLVRLVQLLPHHLGVERAQVPDRPLEPFGEVTPQRHPGGIGQPHHEPVSCAKRRRAAAGSERKSYRAGSARNEVQSARPGSGGANGVPGRSVSRRSGGWSA